MTLEEILNTDWNEQKDLTEYTKFFEDAQNIREQLQRFSFGILRSKLCSLDELREVGIENLNLFNYVGHIVHFKKEDVHKLIIVPVCRPIDEYRMRRRGLIMGYYNEESIRALSSEYSRFHSGPSRKPIEEIAKEVTNDYIERMFRKRDITTDLFDFIFSNALYSLIGNLELGIHIDNGDVEEVNPGTLEKLVKETKYFHSIDISSQDIEEFQDRPAISYHRRDIIFSTQETIDLGFLDEMNELNKNLSYLYSNVLDFYVEEGKYFGYTYKIPQGGLFFINEIRQPILICTESCFNENVINSKSLRVGYHDMINITVDKDNYTVLFEPETGFYDIGLIYQTGHRYYCGRKRKGLVLDLITDDITYKVYSSNE
jgi:hypothetical protein